ncbi:MAG: TonB-dependent receptor, partial [Silicimonas sp.]|nr:TonB-dependent receptor [Silicimonas sp.]
VKGTYSFGDDLAHSVEAGYIRYRGTADDQLLDVIDNAAFFGTVDREVVDETLYATYNYNPASDLIDLDVQLSFGSSANYVTDFRSMAATFNSDYKYEGYGLKVVNRSEWVGETTENYLTYGLELYKQDRITLRDTAGNAQFQPEGKTETVSLFAQNEWVKNDRFTVLTGARLDFQKTKPGPLVPTTLETDEVGKAFTVALHHQTTENLAFFGSASYTERLPVVDELYDSRQAFPGAANLPAVGTLENEISRNIEIGMSYTQSDVLGEGDEITMKATAFRNDLKDLIASNSAAGAGNPNRANIESALIYGVELEAAYESELSFGSLSMTVMNGENRSNPSALNPNLENRIPSDNLRLTLGRRLPARNIELGWTGTFYKGKSRAFSSMGSTNVLSAPSTMIHDVYAAWTPEEGALAGAELRLGVTNVFDKEYRTHLQSGAIRRAGRSVNLTLTKTF